MRPTWKLFSSSQGHDIPLPLDKVAPAPQSCQETISANIKTSPPASKKPIASKFQLKRTSGQTSTRVSNLEKSREILTSLAPSRSKKLNFHSLSLLDFQDFEEKILFLFSIYENLKHKSRSLLDLDLEFSSGSVCVWN